MANTPHIGLPLMAAAQAQKHVTHNAALILLDAMAQCMVKALDVNDPPASPVAGDCYGIGASPTGAFASAPRQLAIFDGYAWQFVMTQKGFLVFNAADQQFWFFDGENWRHFIESVQLPNNFDALGVGTPPDATNRFALKLNATLFSAKSTAENGSGDLRVIMNKQAQSNSVSQVYQTNYSGRAETGLTGDDNFHIKFSPDGTNWKEALIGYIASGAVRIDQLLLARATVANKGRIECDFVAPNSNGAVFSDTSGTASATALAFRKNNTQVGAIQLSSTGTSYATTSDYRIKDVKGPILDGVERLASLRPIRFAFNSDPELELDGFLAHEVASIVPGAVIGEKDALDEQGQAVFQSLDASRLVPLLVAALQEVSVRVRALEAEMRQFRVF